jgi:hypothetical protein
MAGEMDDGHGTRQERRERRQRKQMEMRKHGANLATVYGNAVLKRLDRLTVRPAPSKRR